MEGKKAIIYVVSIFIATLLFVLIIDTIGNKGGVVSQKEYNSKSNAATTASVATQSQPQTTAIPTTKSLSDKAYNDSIFSSSGSSDDVQSFKTDNSYYFMESSHSGSGHFSIKAHYENSYDLLVNTVDNYKGNTLLFPNKEYTLEINSNTKWSVDVYKLGTSSTDEFNGNGDYVTPGCILSSKVYQITASQTSGHFGVKAYYENGNYDLLVNTVGGYSGKVMVGDKGRYSFFVIDSSGDWSILPVSNY